MQHQFGAPTQVTRALRRYRQRRRRYYGDEYVPTILQRLQTVFVHVAINTKKARDDIIRQAEKKARQRLFNES